MLVPPGTAFSELVQHDADYAVVDLRLMPAGGGADPLLALAPPGPVRPGPGAAAALAELEAAWARIPTDPVARLDLRPAAERLVLLVLRAGFAALGALPAAVPDWLRRLRQEAVHDEHHRARSVAALAVRAGCSASHLAHLWKRYFGAGIAADLRRERLTEAAAQLQADPGMAVALVARRWGWDDPRHFARDFRRRFGLPPARWRAGGAGPGDAKIKID
jgi:AraC-like DNA-binding protein